MIDAEKLVKGVADEFRPLWEEQSRQIEDLGRALHRAENERLAAPPVPRDLLQFARDIVAVLGLHDSVGVVALRERAAAVEAMCQQALNG